MRMWLGAGHASGPFNPAMFRYPLFYEPLRGSAGTLMFRRRSWGFSLRSFAPAREVLGRFRPAFPTCRSVNFHLDLFFIEGPTV